jgi:hypothetical protein
LIFKFFEDIHHRDTEAQRKRDEADFGDRTATLGKRGRSRAHSLPKITAFILCPKVINPTNNGLMAEFYSIFIIMITI